MQITIDDIHPTITLNGRLYRASNIRLNGSGKRWADVEYWHNERGWRTVENWDRIEHVANKLWGEKTS